MPRSSFRWPASTKETTETMMPARPRQKNESCTRNVSMTSRHPAAALAPRGRGLPLRLGWGPALERRAVQCLSPSGLAQKGMKVKVAARLRRTGLAVKVAARHEAHS
mmetsp:Transcript_163153/g.523192  ORF Transcript_163153/g.523192 Transcript_163153/m.523192 type:complete len:107 (+) Transcript_163153:1187-1507(+)